MPRSFKLATWVMGYLDLHMPICGSLSRVKNIKTAGNCPISRRLQFIIHAPVLMGEKRRDMILNLKQLWVAAIGLKLLLFRRYVNRPGGNLVNKLREVCLPAS